jgi:hypothetical protein
MNTIQQLKMKIPLSSSRVVSYKQRKYCLELVGQSPLRLRDSLETKQASNRDEKVV